MQTLHFDASLIPWVKQCLSMTDDHELLAMELVKHYGYNWPIATKIVAACVAEKNTNQLHYETRHLIRPHIVLRANRAITEVAAYPVRLQQFDPEIILLDDFLNAEECQQFINLARTRLKDQHEVDQSLAENADAYNDRTSTSCFLNDEDDSLVDRVHQNIMDVLQWQKSAFEK